MKLQNKFRVTCHRIGDIMTAPKKEGELFSATCYAYIYEWLRRQPEFYGRASLSISTDQLEKGLLCEDDSIDYAGDFLGWGYGVKKNTERITLDWIEGEADVVLKKTVEDIKNSWEEKTFPLFDTTIKTKLYWWQLQGYMVLYNKPEAGLVYTLMTAPDHIIERVAHKQARELGFDELPEELFQQVRENMTFDHYPPHLRIKRFSVKRDTIAAGKIYAQVMKIRKFIEDLPDIQTFVTLHEDALIE